MNIGRTHAAHPNTGLRLRFCSDGDSSLVCSLAMVGVLLSILRRSNFIDVTEMPAVKKKILEVRL